MLFFKYGLAISAVDLIIRMVSMVAMLVACFFRRFLNGLHMSPSGLTMVARACLSPSIACADATQSPVVALIEMTGVEFLLELPPRKCGYNEGVGKLVHSPCVYWKCVKA